MTNPSMTSFRFRQDQTDDNPIIEEPLSDHPDPEIDSPEQDVMLDEQSAEFNEFMNKVASMFTPPPTYIMPVSRNDMEGFLNFLNWITHTFGVRYSMINLIINGTVQVTRMPEIKTEYKVNVATSSIAESAIVRPDVCDDDQSTVTGASAFNDESTITSHLPIDEKPGSHGMSIIMQIRNGVIVPPKRKEGRRKNNFENLGISQGEATAIMSKDSKMTLKGFLKKVFMGKGVWRVVANMYDFDKIEILER